MIGTSADEQDMTRFLAGAVAVLLTMLSAGCGAAATTATPAPPPLTDQDRQFIARAEKASGHKFADPAAAVENAKIACDIATSSGPISTQEAAYAALSRLKSIGAEEPAATAGAAVAIYCATFEQKKNWITTRSSDGTG